jgi:hypothetical protein
MKKLFLSLTILVFAVSCASPNYRPRIEKLGAYEDTRALEKRAEKMKSHDVSDIKVFVGDFPAGINIKDEKIVVDERRYEVMGEVWARYRMSYFGWWFYKYAEDESWRNGYCNAQVPLNWLTIGLWGMFVPAYYPCYVSGGGDSVDAIHERELRIVNTLKKAAKAAGGNILILTRQVSDESNKAYAIRKK